MTEEQPAEASRLEILSDGDLKLLAAAFLNLKDPSLAVPNWDQVANEINSKSGESCRVRFNALKRKLAAGNFASPAGGVSKKSPRKVKSNTTKKVKTEQAEDAGENGSPKKKRGRLAKKDKAPAVKEQPQVQVEASETKIMDEFDSDDNTPLFGGEVMDDVI